jgi:hypothetical protein
MVSRLRDRVTARHIGHGRRHLTRHLYLECFTSRLRGRHDRGRDHRNDHEPVQGEAGEMAHVEIVLLGAPVWPSTHRRPEPAQ